MTALQLSPNALTALVLVVMAVAVVVGWRSLRTQIRRIEPASQDSKAADSEPADSKRAESKPAESEPEDAPEQSAADK